MSMSKIPYFPVLFEHVIRIACFHMHYSFDGLSVYGRKKK